jgi:hypothetical protein
VELLHVRPWAIQILGKFLESIGRGLRLKRDLSLSPKYAYKYMTFSPTKYTRHRLVSELFVLFTYYSRKQTV